MDFTDSSYCKISRYLLKCVGSWPRQNSSARRLRLCLITTIMMITICTQTLKTVTSFGHLEMLTETIPPCITLLVCFTKFCTHVFNYEKLERVHDQINENWRNLEIKEEINIVERYVSRGQLYSAFYMIYMYITITVFILLMFEPRIFDIIAPLNETRPLKMIYPAKYYFINEDEHFLLITIHMIISCYAVVTVLIASDTMFIMYIEYVCSMLAVIGYRLERSMYECDDLDRSKAERQGKSYNRYIVNCVHTHRQALKVIDLVQSAFSVPNLVQLGLNIVCLSVTLLQIVILLGKLEILRYIMYAVAQFFHLFCTSYQGQKLIDHSTKTSDKVYNGVWYNTPARTQKLLLFMLARSTLPCYLSAGKIFIFSLKNFSMVVQNCISYFMVLASFQ